MSQSSIPSGKRGWTLLSFGLRVQPLSAGMINANTGKLRCEGREKRTGPILGNPSKNPGTTQRIHNEPFPPKLWWTKLCPGHVPGLCHEDPFTKKKERELRFSLSSRLICIIPVEMKLLEKSNSFPGTPESMWCALDSEVMMPRSGCKWGFCWSFFSVDLSRRINHQLGMYSRPIAVRFHKRTLNYFLRWNLIFYLK